MAFFFVDSLAGNASGFVQISGKILELLLLSMGLISTIVVIKNALNLPYSCEIVFSSLIEFCNSIRCLLSSPPTIILAINLMVLLIFASSAFHRCGDAHHQHQEITTSILDVDDLDFAHHEPPAPAPASAPPQPTPSAPPIWDVVEVTPPLPPPPPSRTDNTSWYDDVSSTQASVGKETAVATLPSPLGKWKDVFIESEEKEATDEEIMEEDNTIDATWEAIIGGGKPKPKKKPLKKSETWDAPPQRQRQPRRLDSEEVVPTSPKWRELRKAETFNDAVSVTRRGGLVRRDPSMSLEEFNQKVERFIKNFNDGIRLQRQESYRRFLDIINPKRG